MVRTASLARTVPSTGPSASAHWPATEQRDSDGNVPSSYFYPELPPREIFVDARSGETSTINNQEVTSSVSTFNQDNKGDNDDEKHHKARFFTFEGLTPVSTVEDSREDLGGRNEVSPVPGPSTNQEPCDVREAPAPLTAAPPNVSPPVRCWSMPEETPFDEDPIVVSPRVLPQSCPNAAAPSAAPFTQSSNEMSTKSEPPLPSRLGTVSDVSADTPPHAVADEAPQPTPIDPAEMHHEPSDEPCKPALASDVALATVMTPVADAAVVLSTTPTENASPAVVVAPFTTQRNPSSLLDEDDDDDDGIVAVANDDVKEDNCEIVVAPTDELIEDRRVVESLLRDAETGAADGGCDVDICKHVLNSSNDLCTGFSNLLPTR
jgi:hypothetical protein